MNEIEAAIVLPPFADGLGSYARYYASGPMNDVLVVYVKPALLIGREREYCEEAELSGQTHQVQCSAIARENAPRLGAGDRYWMKNWTNLPFISDADCGTVVFVFHPSTKRFTENRCLGAVSDPYVIGD